MLLIKKFFRVILIAGVCVSFPVFLDASDIRISNLMVPKDSYSNGSVDIVFDLTWNNSWRTENVDESDSYNVGNWDAAWLFIKFRTGNGVWRHAKLSIDGHSSGNGIALEIEPGLVDIREGYNPTDNPVVGVFIYRKEPGSGDINNQEVTLRWFFSDQGVTKEEGFEIKVFAIEMVYVPSGPFYAGGGGSEVFGFVSAGTLNNPLHITSEWNRSVSEVIGGLWDSSSENNVHFGQEGILSEYFPTGYDGFYSMKYPVSQQMYVDFLNTLTEYQASQRAHTAGTFRSEISFVEGEYVTTKPYLSNNFMSWMDAAAFADWAGLRPMTELEYEKASRGPAYPVADAFVWGNNSAIAGTEILNQGEADERVFPSSANIGSMAFEGPVRVGSFSDSNSDRVSSGASYWGIMQLSGNLWEQVVPIHYIESRNFTGVHGDGLLSSLGYANAPDWPGGGVSEVNSANGAGLRGSAWNSSLEVMRASSRDSISIQIGERVNTRGFRAVRSSPGNSYSGNETYEVVDIDGNKYKTIVIGDQIWMAENLRVTRFSEGSVIQNAITVEEWTNLPVSFSPGWSNYNNDTNLDQNYGKLYNWYAVNDSRGLCPVGWHVPSTSEWQKLENYLGGESEAGGKLKVVGLGFWQSPNSGATNETGFWLLPTGYRSFDGSFGGMGFYTDIRTSSDYNGNFSIVRSVTHDTEAVYTNNYNKGSGYVVRCLQDNPVGSLPSILTTEIQEVRSKQVTVSVNIGDIGTSQIISKGVCIASTQDMETGRNCRTHQTVSGNVGVFNIAITNLNPLTDYYIQSFAENVAGFVYGDVLGFETSDTEPASRTIASGSWSDLSIWETFIDEAWVVATSTPEGSGSLLISHAVTLDENLSVSGDIKIEADGALTLGEEITLTFASGGSYEHAINGGSIPVAIWEEGSTILFTGITGNAPSNRNQNFHNVVWNNPGQSSNLHMDWNNNIISGDVTVLSSGATNRLQLTGLGFGQSREFTILGDVIVHDGQLTTQATGTAENEIIVNHYGNVVLNAGNFSIARGTQGGGTGTTTWNMKGGNFTVNGGFMQNSNATGAKWVFVGELSPQTIFIASSAIIQGAALNIDVVENTILNLGYTQLRGSASFSVLAGGEVQTAHVDGIAGNFTTSATVSLSEGANYTFNGSVAQVTSTALPATVNNLTIDNPDGVRLSQQTEINGTLLLQSGVFDNSIPFLLGPGASIEYVAGSLLVSDIFDSFENQVRFENLEVVELSQYAATLSIEVISISPADNISIGICTSLSTTPSLENVCSSFPKESGVYTTQRPGLSGGSTYYTRPYITIGSETFYGSVTSFSTPYFSQHTPVTDIDGNIYNTIAVGSSLWMTENLRTTRYRDGTQIPNVTSMANWGSMTSGAWSYYENQSVHNNSYGKLYNWFAVNDERGLCPTGWSIPTDEQWTQFINRLGSSPGSKMKALEAWNDEANNLAGFSGLPGGRNNGASFNYIGSEGYWWTSSQSSTHTAFWRALYKDFGGVERGSYDKRAGYSVRCFVNTYFFFQPVFYNY